MDQQNIRVIFTAKANSALEDLINNFKLQETPEDYVEKNKQNKPSSMSLIPRPSASRRGVIPLGT